MESPEKKYPVLYYDMDNTDIDILIAVQEQLKAYFEREKVPFIFLPKELTMGWQTKDETIDYLERLIKEVKKWE